MAAKKIQIFYDVLSPYSWIGFEILCRYRSRWNIKLEFCPFSLSGIMRGSKNTPPHSIPAKIAYIQLDLKRLAKYYEIPFALPSNPNQVLFQKGSLKAQLLLIATELTSPDKLEILSRQLWLRVWSRDEDIVDDESLQEAGKKAGLSEEEIDKLLEMAQTEEAKEKLEQNTQEALELGSFGAPFIVVHMEDGKKESFFGGDRMELLASMIGEKWEGPLAELKAEY